MREKGGMIAEFLRSQVEQESFSQLKIEIVPGTFSLMSEIEWEDDIGAKSLSLKITNIRGFFRSTLLRTSTLILLRVHHNQNCAFPTMTTTTN